MEQNEIIKLIRKEIGTAAQDQQYGVKRVPYHIHNNLDAPKLQFIGLSDTPGSFTGYAGQVPVVNSLETALEFKAFSSGVYTPTLTNVANLDGSTAFECQYMRVSTVVTVSGKVSVNPTTTATSTQLGISLPVASNLGAQEDCAGTAFASAVAGQGASILGDATNNRAQMQWIATDITDQPMYFIFSYQII